MKGDVFDAPPSAFKRDKKSRGWLKPSAEKQEAMKQRNENRTLKAQMEALVARLEAVESAGEVKKGKKK
jgi:hypothetical protein